MGCEVCGLPTKVFASSGRAAKFCGLHGGKVSLPVKVLPARTCAACPVSFTPTHGSQKFCSDACRAGTKKKKSPAPEQADDKKAGRPEHQPTPTLRKKVAAAAGGGMSHEEIALGLGISRTTLKKHYEHELSIGAYTKRIEMLYAMHRAGKKGSVAAQKAYMAQTPRAAAPPGPDPEPSRPEPPIGKKDQAQKDAVTAAAGTEWSTLLDKPPVH